MSTSSLSDVLSPHLTQSSSQYIPIRPNARLDQHCALGAPIDSDAQGHDSASAESGYEHQYNHHPLRAHSLTEGSPAPRQSGRQMASLTVARYDTIVRELHTILPVVSQSAVEQQSPPFIASQAQTAHLRTVYYKHHRSQNPSAYSCTVRVRLRPAQAPHHTSGLGL